ncbi:hypothetical protein [Paraliomyxa miuraensis]|uniref:hypothetical protein n=1 Tax=Paraliomyxa miuraensis TaxID=376150 RepID=UPI00224FC278|nr:hypothetical protein [Paraliomyxa miuraensis]MCX4243323.1 hypothetical protein [Paraliomyxa miuraensis]
MLPELSVLYRDTLAPPEPPSPALSLVAERSAGAETPVRARAPRWSLLALEREVALRGVGVPEPIGAVRGVLMPVALGATAVAGMVAVAGLLVALGVASVVAVAAGTVARLSVTRRWCERQRRARLDHEAVHLKAYLMTKLRRDHREELECLATLVENVREHEGLRPGPCVSTLVARLDALLLSYVDRAIEVRSVAAAFAVTMDDEPGLPAALRQAEAVDAIDEAERKRCFQILHLRTRAREMCRRRIRRMERELASIGQLVRLVHEQALASGLPHDELAGMLAEVLDEAEHARIAREELEEAMASARDESLEASVPARLVDPSRGRDIERSSAR